MPERDPLTNTLRAAASLLLAADSAKFLNKSDLTPKEIEEVISLIDLDSFCDLIESVYYEYSEEVEAGSTFTSPEEYFLEKIPEQVRIWRQTNVEPLVDAIKEGY